MITFYLDMMNTKDLFMQPCCIMALGRQSEPVPLSTANQKAAAGTGRFPGKGGDPDLPAGSQCEWDFNTKASRQNSFIYFL